MKFSDFKSHVNQEDQHGRSSDSVNQRYKDLDSILNVVKNINSTIDLDDVLAVVLNPRY